MIAARWPRGRAQAEKLLHIDPDAGGFCDQRIEDLPRLLRAGDLLVVNDAATLPASLAATTQAGTRFEVRLLHETKASMWSAALFGPGDWRTDTEQRAAPPELVVGEQIDLAQGAVRARVASVCSPRLVRLEMDRPRHKVLSAIYQHGRPVQYAYVADTLDLEAVQTPYAGRPWASEMPSAGRPLRWSVLLEARRRGVELAAVTHAVGLSSIGDAALDAALPFAEAYEVSQRTVDAVRVSKARRGRVVAVGTSAARALEGCARSHGGQLAAGQGSTDLLIGPDYQPKVVDGILSNMHGPGESHFELLSAFAPSDLLARASQHAEASGYLAHEFGDSCLVLS